jgi:Xaa-Pro aminopeptidase
VPDNQVDYAARVGALATSSQDGPPPDAILISAASNIHYLSGFTGSNALLLIARGSATLFTDPRYTIQAAQQCPFPARVEKGPLVQAVSNVLKTSKVRRLAFERNRISFEAWETLKRAVPPTCGLLPVNSAVERLRMRKSPQEIEWIRESVETNSRALRRAMKRFRAGMRESELAAEIDYQSRRAGAEMPAFETIVAAGLRSALPHARPTDAKIVTKSALLIDMGAFQNGYASDMTRTMYVGKAPKRFKTMYRAVLEAQLAAIKAVRPGVSAAKVDLAARAVLESSGFGDAFVHSTGHGLGLEIHESPRIGKKEKSLLETGFVITIEPGVYFEDYGGVRIEDTVVVTDAGCEILTPTSKELVEL